MKLYAISGYEQFRCLMDRCAHTCCAGWEIDIDEESLERYRRTGGTIGEKLREKINWEAGCFRLEEDERCPFLTKSGLCQLILTLGENSLCQICADHPRYRSFLPGRIEIGLGLCCEAAGRLLLSREKKTGLVLLEDNGQPEEEDDGFLLWRDQLLAMAQDRTLPMTERANRLLACAGMDNDIHPEKWAAELKKLERLDMAWEDCLLRLEQKEKTVDARWEIPLEQLMAYLLYRHLPAGMEDGDFSGHLAYCAVMWRLLRHMFSHDQTMDGLVETARLYSSEIEYSDENVEAVLDVIDRQLRKGMV